MEDNTLTITTLDQEALPSVEIVENKKETSIIRKLALTVTLTFVGIFLILGLSYNNYLGAHPKSLLRSLLERTIEGNPMPVPFWIIRQDVPEPFKIQNAFYNFYYVKNKVISLTQSSSKYSVKFWDSVSAVNEDGKEIKLGYFNPLSPNGLPSNVFFFEYGDRCEETDDFRQGKLELKCGDELELVSVSEVEPCKYKVIATAPERCSKNHSHSLRKSK
jgi:hypothetical protein